ncbi:unnamed protein product [Thelazia callipaeda]|uniref:RING-type domain-containing protein n=1 Tax=Thelazia callipaeda TaxID=103827 RepID=A0A0N5CZL9_THECL|nr:unnamed protein product [Thelazia callipaeda]
MSARDIGSNIQKNNRQISSSVTPSELNAASTPTASLSTISKQLFSSPSSLLNDLVETHCHLCSKVQPYSAFIVLRCKHGFCGQCASIIDRTQVCPLCFNTAATELASSLTGISQHATSIFPDAPPSREINASNLSLDGAFSIWDPLLPKSLIKQGLQRSAIQSSTQSRNQLLHSSQQYSATGSSFDPSLLTFQNDTAAALGVLSLSSQPLITTSTINWHTVPSAEIQQTFNIKYQKCTMCSEGNHLFKDNAVATVRCVQCDETLCSECVVAHYRMRVTREHKVVRIETFKGVSLPQMSVRREPIKFENLIEIETCSTHDSPMICSCLSCGNAPLCVVCVVKHPKHQLVPYGELRASLLALIASSKHDQKNLEVALETVRQMLERVDASVQSTIRELRSAIHLHISALEERKRDLLQRVDTIRQTKINTLKAQGERLGQRHIILAEALKAAEVATSTGEGMEIQQRNSFDTLLSILREPCLCLMPHETDLIKFLPPNSSFITQYKMCSTHDSPINCSCLSYGNVTLCVVYVVRHPDINFTNVFIIESLSLVTVNFRLRSLGELESGACARTTHIIGEGFRRAIQDRSCTILVQARDACGDVCTSTVHQLSASLISPEGHVVEISISIQDAGVYSLSYFPTEEGNYFLDIKIRGVSIGGCPTIIYARKGRDYGKIVRTGPLFSFGSEGTGDGQLCRPWGICCDNKGRIVVADRSNNRIQLFDKEGNFLFKFGSPGTRPGQFDRPAGIAVNSLNEIVVADKDNHRIQVFNDRGDFLLKFGERGRTPGLFNYPWGVAVNSFNQIAVSDTRNHRIQASFCLEKFYSVMMFSPQGHFIRKFGFDSSLHSYKNLDSPRGLCFLQDGQLVVTFIISSDFNNHRLVVMSSRNTSDMKMYGSEGDREGLFCRPQGITTDNEGHILVCDSRNNRIQVLNLDGMECVASFGAVLSDFSSEASISNTGNEKSGESAKAPLTVMLPIHSSKVPSCSGVSVSTNEPNLLILDRPTDLCISPDGLIYVVDFGASCIRVF